MTRREKDARDLDLAFATLVIGLAPLLTINVAYAGHPIPSMESLPAVEFRPAKGALWCAQHEVLMAKDMAWLKYEGLSKEHGDE